MSRGARIVAIADIHLAPPDEPPHRYHGEWDYAGAAERLRQTLRLAREAEPDLLAVLGDVSQRGDVRTTAEALGEIAACGLPTRIVAGNHDCDVVPRLTRSKAPLATPASEPLASGVAVAGVALRGDAGAFCGSLDCSRWPRQPVVVLSHFPLLSRREELLARGLGYPGDVLDHAQLAEALTAREAPTIALTGHVHMRDSSARGPLLQLGCAAQIEPPHDATIVDVAPDGCTVTIRRRPIGDGALPADEAWAYRDRAWVRCA